METSLSPAGHRFGAHIQAAHERFINYRKGEIAKDPRLLTIAFCQYAELHHEKIGRLLNHLDATNEILRRAACAEMGEVLDRAIDQLACKEWHEGEEA